jgi:hypothetical protein
MENEHRKNEEGLGRHVDGYERGRGHVGASPSAESNGWRSRLNYEVDVHNFWKNE